MTYTKMAYYYDDLMKHAPYDQWVNFTQSIFKRYKKSVQTITDLGCGTGEITLRLAQLNYEMIGIDYSPHMLAMADQKAQAKGQRVQWMYQDLRQLEGLYKQDVMISYCDVINYIPSITDLKIVFNNVYQSLSKDGLFIFDVHDFNYANQYLMNNTFAEVTDEFTYIWFCHEGEVSGEMFHELTFFAQNEHGTYDQFSEVHEQRTYEEYIYKELLEESGFQQIDIYDDFQLECSKSNKQRERVFFVALK